MNVVLRLRNSVHLCQRHVYFLLQRNFSFHENAYCIQRSQLDNRKIFLKEWPSKINGDACSYRSWVSVVRSIHTQPKRMAGPNRPMNVKHLIKGRLASKRATILEQRVRNVVGAANKQKETNPKFNPDLANAIAAAKKSGVPNHVIERNLDRINRSSISPKPRIIEASGPDGITALLHCDIQNKNELQSLISPLRKKGFHFGKVSVMYQYEHKGVITLCPQEEGQVDMDKYLEMGLEVGVEEVTMETDENDQSVIQFICEPGDLNMICSQLEKMGLNDLSSQEVYSPKTPVPVSKEYAEQLHSSFENIMDKFNYVEDVTFNFEVEDENN